jgi:hypothetical protein
MLQSFDAMHKKCGSCVYWGENGEWLVAAGRHRDSDVLERSNFLEMLHRLGGEGEAVTVERETHWAVGWVEHMLIDPADTARVALVEQWREEIEDYPVLSEDRMSQMESDEFFEFAEGELKSYGDGWQDALEQVTEELQLCTGCGNESDDWAAIEAARELLENPPPPAPKDVNGQAYLFDGEVPPLPN